MSLLLLLLFLFIYDGGIEVQNSTPIDNMSEIIKTGAYVAGIHNATIFVLPFNKRIQNAYEKKYYHKISGHVVKNKDGSYVIYLDVSLDDDKLIKVISHELIHIKQMQKNMKRLFILGLKIY